MDLSKNLSPSPTDLIDWMNDENLLDLDWDFPEDGDLIEAGLDSTGVAHLVAALEDEYGVEIAPEEIADVKPLTPASLALLISSRA